MTGLAHTPPAHLQSGRVYKGLWRGTTVAVKLVVLTNNMSGAEKVGYIEPGVLPWFYLDFFAYANPVRTYKTMM